MKRWIASLLTLALLLAGAGCAESTMVELRNMRKSAGDRILEIEPVPVPGIADTPEPAPTPEAHYEPLASGMKGDAVREMQQRLIDLGYLGGAADGSYGGKTAAAVKAFQQSAGFEPTGEADGETLAALFNAVAPVKQQYEKLDYRRASEEPDACRGARVEFKGRVLQVLEDDAYADTLGVYTALRIATRGEYDDVAYVAFFRDKASEPLSDGETVNVRGALEGEYRYTTEAGDEITLPRIGAEAVEKQP